VEHLSALEDVEAIRSLMYRYARGIDDRDLDEVVACFTADADVAVEGSDVGVPDVRAFFGALLGGSRDLGPTSSHAMSNVLVDVEGDSARASTRGVAYLLRGDVVMVRGVRYDDVCSRTADGWRIVKRRHRAQWQFEAPASAVSALTS
jgi:hypothetical protein